MLYHIQRSGQQYGPYTLEDLRAYVTSGNVLLTDLAKSDEMPDWLPVSQVLNVATSAPVVPYGSSPAPYPQTSAVYPDPPNLHWGLVLLIGIFTCGIFSIVWIFVQAAWVRKVDPRSKAIFYYIAAIVLDFFNVFVELSTRSAGTNGNVTSGTLAAVSLMASLVMVVLFIVANFSMRDSIEEHFNGPEPIGLSLSGVMTFFFSIYYFQYHFTRINELKRASRYGGTAV